jgi:hypothetical protein
MLKTLSYLRLTFVVSAECMGSVRVRGSYVKYGTWEATYYYYEYQVLGRVDYVVVASLG